MTDAFDRAAKRSLRVDGRPATLINPTNPTRHPDHGDVTWQGTNETTITADLTYRGNPSFEKRADAIDADIDVIAWVTDDYATSVTTGEEDDETAATRLRVEGQNYAIRDTFTEDNGLIRCHGVEEDGEPWRN